jgi:hypothetical protein
MSASLITSKVGVLLKENYGVRFNMWARVYAENDFVNIYSETFGGDNVRMVAYAKNLAYALHSFVIYSSELSEKEYATFLFNMIDKQFPTA